MPELELAAQLEAILFIQTEPVSVRRLSQITGRSTAETQAALNQLQAERSRGGIRLSQLGTSYQLVTAPEVSALLNQLAPEPTKAELSPAALETLAVIAYQGPVTIRQISDQRGVASDTMVRNLIARGLVEPASSSRQPGDTPRYQVSFAFLEHFGLTSTNDLPQPASSIPEANHAH